MYDSTKDTLAHIERVQTLLNEAILELKYKAEEHDKTKLYSPEKEIFDEMTPKLKGSTYGSEEYKVFLQTMKIALDHHYKYNEHHPEHDKANGIDGMTLLDLIEMLCDWKAATERHADGDIYKSLIINKERFKISDQLAQILYNTVNQLF
jgi:hypothetical protein